MFSNHSYIHSWFVAKSMQEVFLNDNQFSIWIEIEIALAQAEELCGVIPKDSATNIEKKLKNFQLDLEQLKMEYGKIGFPILPFINQLTNACDDETARWVHFGATTQDIIDTGLVLQSREGLFLLEQDISRVINALVTLARQHRDSVMAGRTFQQLAAPITFGYKAAIWLDEILRHQERLDAMKPRLLVGQCAGAVGTFATLGDQGLAVQKEMMTILGLGTPDITWHTARDRWAELISWMAMLTATLAKIATEIAILMRSEIGEVSESYRPGQGASTTMPQKRNPIHCQPVIAIAHKLRELAGSQLTAMIQEHERGVGQMHLEWLVIPEAFILTAGALEHMVALLDNLQVFPDSMLANMNLDGGLMMSEAVMMALASKLGKHQAHKLISSIAGRAKDDGVTLKEALLSDDEVMQHLDESQLDSLLDPSSYTGMAGDMVDAVLALARDKGYAV